MAQIYCHLDTFKKEKNLFSYKTWFTFQVWGKISVHVWWLSWQLPLGGFSECILGMWGPCFLLGSWGWCGCRRFWSRTGLCAWSRRGPTWAAFFSASEAPCHTRRPRHSPIKIRTRRGLNWLSLKAFLTRNANGSFGKEQGLLRLLRTQPHRKYQSYTQLLVKNTSIRSVVPKLPLLYLIVWPNF